MNAKIIKSKRGGLKIKFSLLFLLSIFFHIFLFNISFLYYTNSQKNYAIFSKLFKNDKNTDMYYDLAVNINQNDKKDYKDRTILSDRDSKGTGKLTKEKGQNWLSDSTTFEKKGVKDSNLSNNKSESGTKDKTTNILISKNYILYKIRITKDFLKSRINEKVNDIRGNSYRNRVPDIGDFTKANSIFYSNNDHFSLNTKKYKNFEYFNHMKNKIRSNWNFPIMANSTLPKLTAPGRTKVSMITRVQIVYTYFVLNRNGDVIKIKKVGSNANEIIDDSCIDAIKNSKTFGPVPSDVIGDDDYFEIFWTFGVYPN